MSQETVKCVVQIELTFGQQETNKINVEVNLPKEQWDHFEANPSDFHANLNVLKVVEPTQ